MANFNKWHGLWAGLLALAIVGCKGGSDTSTATKEGDSKTASSDKPANTGKKIQIGVVFDSGGKNDKSFNQSAYEGLQRAQKDLGIEFHDVECRSAKDVEPNLTTMAEQNFDLVLAIGINQAKPLENVAAKFPKINFAIVDGMVKAPNVRALLFSENEGSFLAGYLAGLMTKTKKLGFVGGMELPLIKKFEAGYIAGAKTADPSVEVLPAKYTGDWSNVDKGKAAAQLLFGSGADIVYHAAGKAGEGVIAAAKDAGKYAIGVDKDQDDLEQGFVLTSMVKHVDEAVYQTVKDVQDGKFTAGDKIYDLKNKGVGLSEMKFTKDKIGAENLKKVQEISDKIVSGEIKVPATMEELKK